MDTDRNMFSYADYIVFIGILLISAGIGVYHAAFGGKQKTTEEFLMANRSMRFLPISLSVLASFFSASTLLGTPAEIYVHGTQYWMSVFGAVLAPITGALLFGPMFFKLKIVSVFQYLEMRFRSKSVRLFGAVIFIIRTTIGMGIVLYGPSTALSAVTVIPVWATIVSIGVVCTFYTALGGLKAVIWTDVFQTFIMMAGMLAVLIQGVINLGGMSEVWKISEAGERIEFFNFDPDPTVRHTFWTLVVGIYFVWLPPYTVDQQMVQRFSSARSLRDAKIALLLNVPGMFLLITLCSVTGLVMYANYATCDPLKEGLVSNQNQLLPFYTLDILGRFPGLPGLFVASLFSGALSSVSSMMNSLAAVTWEDFLKIRYGYLPDAKVTWITKGLAVFFGALGIGMAFLVAQLGGTVLQASLTLNGAAGAPLVGLFILGAFCSRSNWIGALVGGFIGFAVPMWLSVGAYISKPIQSKLPMSTLGCNATNLTYSPMTSSTPAMSTFTMILPTKHATEQGSHGIDDMYTLSYLWFSAVGIFLVIVIGMLVSLCTGGTKGMIIEDRLLINPFVCWQRPNLDDRKLNDNDSFYDERDEWKGTHENTSL